MLLAEVMCNFPHFNSCVTLKSTLIFLIAEDKGINEEGCKSCKLNKLGGGNKREQGTAIAR